MINKTKTIFCVCALTASAFAWNAMADDVVYNGVFWGNTGAWTLNSGGTEQNAHTMFEALHEDAVLSIAVERNTTDAGFKFGTYTYDTITDTITSKTTLGTVNVGEKTINPNKGVNLGNESVTYSQNFTADASGIAYSEAFNPKANELVGIWVQEKGSDLVYYSDNRLTLRYGADSKTVAGYTNESKYPDSNYVSEDEFNAILEADPDNKENKTTFTRIEYTDARMENSSVGNVSIWFDDAVNPQDDVYKTWFGFPGEDANPTSIKLRVTGIASGAEFASHPSGGPLPGVWATIALAGVVGTYLRRRKNK